MKTDPCPHIQDKVNAIRCLKRVRPGFRLFAVSPKYSFQNVSVTEFKRFTFGVLKSQSQFHGFPA